MENTLATTLNRGQQVGLAVKPFQLLIADFEPLQNALTETAALVTALAGKGATQDQDTTATTVGKDQERETMARTTEALSNRMMAYALVQGDLQLQRQFGLSYTEVRFGEADEDVNDVRELVARARALPADVRKAYRLTDTLIEAPADAATAFETASATQTSAKAEVRLAHLSAPELAVQLQRQLEIGRRLLTGMKSEGGKWADLFAAFQDANKRRKLGGDKPATQAPRVVKRLSFHRQDGTAQRLDKQNYGPAYELEIKNLSATDLLLWMSLAKQPTGAAPATAVRCPAGKTSKVRRAALGEELARYLTGQFAGEAGGEVRIAVRRVV